MVNTSRPRGTKQRQTMNTLRKHTNTKRHTQYKQQETRNKTQNMKQNYTHQETNHNHIEHMKHLNINNGQTDIQHKHNTTIKNDDCMHRMEYNI